VKAQDATKVHGPRAYVGFDGQYIGGSCRPGQQGGKLKDTDPYSGETLAEIVMVREGDLDGADQFV
jgi:aldehyde dehydrogenase (NAD+)